MSLNKQDLVTSMTNHFHKLTTHINHEQRSVTLFLVVLGALLIRLSIMFTFETYLFPDDKSFGAEMGWIAHNLTEGNGFIVGGLGGTVYYAWMAPLYPFILSLIFGTFGSYTLSSAVAILVMQAIISSLVSIPLYFIAEEVYDRRVALIATVLWAIHPGSIIYAVERVWSSSFTALGLTTAFWILLKIQQCPKSRTGALLCGVVIGLTSLSDPTAISLAPVATLWLIWRSKNNRRGTIRQLILIGLAGTVIITPWIIRNYRIFDQFVPIKSTFGVNFWQGNHGHNINQPTAGIGFGYRVEENFSEEEFNYLISLNEVERASFFLNEAIEFIAANPVTFAQYTIWRIYLFWRLFAFPILGIFLLPYYLLIAIGFIISKQKWAYTILFLLLFAIFPVPYYLSIMDTYRYRFPIEGLFLVPLAYSIRYLPPLAHSFLNEVFINRLQQK